MTRLAGELIYLLYVHSTQALKEIYMLSIVLKPLISVSLKMFSVVATEVMVQWLLLKVGKVIVESTKNTHDDEFYDKLVQLLDKEDKK